MEIESEDLHECSMWWSQLPNNLQEKVLAWLPLEKLCRYCGVCKQWNALFSSPEFISKYWVAAPPNKKPWLVLEHESQSLNCTVYCSFTNTWKTLSFAFLWQKYDVRYYSIHGSAAGLFLVSIFYREHRRGTYEIAYAVCNPVRGTSLQLPRIGKGHITPMNIVAGEDSYKVIAIVKCGVDALRIEIYDSTLMSWSTAGHVPQNLEGPRLELTVVSEDIFYWTSSDANSMRSGIAGFNIQNETFFFIPFQDENDDDSSRVDVLFTCGSRVLVASCIYNLDGVIQWDVGGVIIWEIERPKLHERHDNMMKEIARMPQFFVEYFQRRSAGYVKFSFEGMKEMVYIRYKCGLGNELLIYNLCDNIWKWLPGCPVVEPRNLIASSSELVPSMFVFEPRPLMTVERITNST